MSISAPKPSHPTAPARQSVSAPQRPKVTWVPGRDWTPFAWGNQQQELQRRLKVVLKKDIAVEVDFELFNDPAWKAQEQEKKLEKAVDYLLPTAVRVLEDVAYWDELNVELMQPINKLLFCYDTSNSQNDITQDKQYTVSLDEAGTLLVLYNVTCKGLDNFHTKLQIALKMNSLGKFKRDSEKKFSELSKELGALVQKDIPIEVDLDNFVDHPAFLTYDYSDQECLMTRLYENHSSWICNEPRYLQFSLLGVLRHNPYLSETVTKCVDRIKITYDPTSSVNWSLGGRSQSHYMIDYNNRVLTLIMNLDKGISGTIFNVHKTLKPLILAQYTIDELKRDIQQGEVILQSAFGRQLPIQVDWRNWIIYEKFLGLPEDKQISIQKAIAQFDKNCLVAEYQHNYVFKDDSRLVDESPGHRESMMSAALVTLSRLAQHPISKEKFGRVSRIVFCELPEISEQSAVLLRGGYLYFHGNFYKNLQISTYDMLSSVEWQLGTSLPTYNDLAIKMVEQHRARISPGPDINVNWDFIQDPAFVQYGNLSCLAKIQEVADLVKHLFEDLKSVAAHPIGSKCVSEKIHHLSLFYGLSSSVVSPSATVAKPVVSMTTTTTVVTPVVQAASQASTSISDVRNKVSDIVTAFYQNFTCLEKDSIPKVVEIVMNRGSREELSFLDEDVPPKRKAAFDSAVEELVRQATELIPAPIEATQVKCVDIRPQVQSAVNSFFEKFSFLEEESIPKVVEVIMSQGKIEDLAFLDDDVPPKRKQEFDAIRATLFQELSSLHKPEDATPMAVTSVDIRPQVQATVTAFFEKFSFLEEESIPKVVEVIMSQGKIEDLAFLDDDVPPKRKQEFDTARSNCFQDLSSLHPPQQVPKKADVGQLDNVGTLSVPTPTYTPVIKSEKLKEYLFEIQGTTIQIVVDEATLTSCLKSCFKDRVRFEYGLLVPEAVHDATSEASRLQKRVEDILGRSFPMSLDLGWTEHSNFRSLSYSEQYNAVFYVLTKFLHTAVEKEGGIISLLQHPTGAPREVIAKEITELKIFVDSGKGTEILKSYNGTPINIQDPKPQGNGPTNVGGLSKANGVFTYTLPLDQIYFSGIAVDWKDRVLDLFNLIVAIACKEEEATYQSHLGTLTSALGKNISVDIQYDTFTREPGFTELPPADRTLIVKNLLTNVFTKVFFGDYGLTGLCEFSETRQALQAINSIEINIDTTAKAASSQGPAGTFSSGILSFVFPIASVRSNEVGPCGTEVEKLLKLRTIKEDAVFAEGTAKAEAECNSFHSVLGKKVTFAINWESLRKDQKFVHTTDIVAYVKLARVFAKILPHILLQSQSSIRCLVSDNEPLKDALVRLDTYLLSVGPTHNYVLPKLNGSTLEFIVDSSKINDVATATTFPDFKELLLDLFDLVVPTAQHETRSTFESSVSKVSKSLGSSLPVTVDWSFTKSPQFLSCSAPLRFLTVSNLQTTVTESLLLGNSGFTGTLGLCEFSEVVGAINQSIKAIAITISGSRQSVEVNGGVCEVKFSLENLQGGNVSGIHEYLEKCLNLRPIKEAAVRNEQDRVIASSCTLPCPVVIDWSTLKTSTDYVSETRTASKLVQWVIMQSGGSGWGNYSVSSMCKESSKVAAALKGLQHLKIQFSNFSPAKQGQGLLPTNYKAQQAGQECILQFSQSLSTSDHQGPGLIIEFCLCPSESSKRETAELERIAEERRRAEEERLRREEEARIRQEEERQRKEEERKPREEAAIQKKEEENQKKLDEKKQKDAAAADKKKQEAALAAEVKRSRSGCGTDMPSSFIRVCLNCIKARLGNTGVCAGCKVSGFMQSQHGAKSCKKCTTRQGGGKGSGQDNSYACIHCGKSSATFRHYEFCQSCASVARPGHLCLYNYCSSL